MNKTLLMVVTCIGLLGSLVFYAMRTQRVLSESLPPKIVCLSQESAKETAIYHAMFLVENGHVTSILGTGSMYPYLPKAQENEDPYKTVVAYGVYTTAVKYEDIKKGDLVIYHPQSNPDRNWIHVAYEKDANGWIMSGLNNARSESWMRVTKDNYVGVTLKIFVWSE